MPVGAVCLEKGEKHGRGPEGETWGDERLTLGFPGGPYLLEGLDPHGAAVVMERYGPLCSGDAAAAGPQAALVRFLRTRPGDLRPAPEPPTGVYELEIDHAPGTVRLTGRGWFGRIETEAPLRAGLFTPAAVPEDFVAILENTLRVTAAYRLFDQGGFLLHSAGVVSKGRAYLFAGRSGAGKTTFARRSLAEGREVLSDDLNAVVLERGELRVRQVPFAGELGMTLPAGPLRDYPLAGVFGLAHLAEAEAPAVVSPLPGAEALALLLCAASGINGDPGRQERLMESLAGLLARVRRGRVAFSLRGPVWSALEGNEP